MLQVIHMASNANTYTRGTRNVGTVQGTGHTSARDIHEGAEGGGNTVCVFYAHKTG